MHCLKGLHAEKKFFVAALAKPRFDPSTSLRTLNALWLDPSTSLRMRDKRKKTRYRNIRLQNQREF
jgi:hypothetical protein